MNAAIRNHTVGRLERQKPRDFGHMCVVFGLEISIRTVTVTNGTEFSPTRDTQPKTRKPQQRGSTFQLNLQLLGLYAELEIFRLVE